MNRIFDYYLSYKKGAGVVHMLRYLLNDDAKFFRALRTYQSQFGGSTVRTPRPRGSRHPTGTAGRA